MEYRERLAYILLADAIIDAAKRDYPDFYDKLGDLPGAAIENVAKVMKGVKLRPLLPLTSTRSIERHFESLTDKISLEDIRHFDSTAFAQVILSLLGRTSKVPERAARFLEQNGVKEIPIWEDGEALEDIYKQAYRALELWSEKTESVRVTGQESLVESDQKRLDSMIRRAVSALQDLQIEIPKDRQVDWMIYYLERLHG